MDKLSLLKTRRDELKTASSEVRKKIAELIDSDSFVELDSYSFSKNEFYGEDIPGEGVVTGYATINDFPCFVVALNSQILSGGLTNAGCKKIVKCQQKALNTATAVVYLLSTKGVLAGEGVACLEGVAEVLAKMEELKGVAPQFSVAMGDVLGQGALFVASSDFSYFFKDSCVAYGSPLVISAASGKSLDKNMVGGLGSNAYNGLATFEVSSMGDVKESIANVLGILPEYSGLFVDSLDDANRNAPNLNEKVDANALVAATFDEGNYVELNKGFEDSVKTYIGRVGGYSVGSLIFEGENGVELNNNVIEKVKNFMYFCADNDLPVVTFVNTLGLKNDMQTSNTTVMKNVSNLICALKVDIPKINVIYGKAIGLGYTLFGSKAFGVDYSYAFANAQIATFNSEVGAEIEVANVGGNLDEVKARYEEEQMDAMNAAKNGYIDDVIEPQYVRQYLISALQMLV